MQRTTTIFTEFAKDLEIDILDPPMGIDYSGMHFIFQNYLSDLYGFHRGISYESNTPSKYRLEILK